MKKNTTYQLLPITKRKNKHQLLKRKKKMKLSEKYRPERHCRKEQNEN